jgi:hypothetical protein
LNGWGPREEMKTLIFPIPIIKKRKKEEEKHIFIP